MPVKLLNKFTLGCDPEFVATKAGRNVTIFERLQAQDVVGYDHGGRVLELRPYPHRGAYSLLKEIRSVFNRKHPNTQILQEFHLKAGGVAGPESLGGHVHFGFTPGVIGNQHFTPEQLTALDAVARILIRLDILPLEESRQRQELGHYGKYGDFRVSQASLEYRSMPSWLYSPKATMLAVTCAKLALVDPAGTTAALQPGGAGFPALETWLETFKDRDDNARRILERIPLRDFKAQPDADLNEVWRRPLGF